MSNEPRTELEEEILRDIARALFTTEEQDESATRRFLRNIGLIEEEGDK